jgi:hypothetical protein
MIWSVDYERNNKNRTQVNTTFVTKTEFTELAIEKFERMHKYRLTVIECKPKAKQWQLSRVFDIAWTQDRSGVYIYINWDRATESVRLDLMTEGEAEPLQSFIGKADNVRKAAMRWLCDNVGVAAKIKGLSTCGVSLEHAAYIGAELERCDTERIDYIQS